MRAKSKYASLWSVGLVAAFSVPAAAAESATGLALSVRDRSNAAVVGEQTSYTLVVNNHGPQDVADITLTDGISPTLRLVSVEPTHGYCTSVDGLICCSLGTLGAKQSAEVRVVVIPQATGQHSNGASIYAPTAESTHNSKTVTVITAQAKAQ